MSFFALFRWFPAFLMLVLMACAVAPAAEQVDEAPIIDPMDIHHPVAGRSGMVVSQSMIASEVGADILARGGNAVDAAVAVGFALAVTLPRAGNLGGGGFMLVYLAEEESVFAFDYREMAPAAATRDMYLDEEGEVDLKRVRFSHKSAGVPGTVAGLYRVHQRFGTLKWSELVVPAMKLANDGFVVGYDFSGSLKRRQDRLTRNPATRAAFFKEGGVPYEAGELFKQKDLAWTLKHIARSGPAGFYEGPVARKIVADMQANDGLITMDDLANYRVVEREPVRGTYRGYEIVSMPPPSSGGVHVIQMLNVLENFPVPEMGAGSADFLHLLAETMRLAYADRSEHLGDPDFYDVPVDWLTSKKYARELASGIDMGKARDSAEVNPGVPAPGESFDTTHFSVMDKSGNMVSSTYTLNFSYGSGLTVAGAGFLLNNEMDDFSAKPGEPNAFGLLGGEANAVEAGKRPLSSMTPTLVFKGGEPFLATGSPGGSRIITAVLQLLVNVIDHGMNIADATHQPRIHHQWLPDILQHEGAVNPDTLKILASRGHDLRQSSALGALETLSYRNGIFYGCSDPRRPDSGAVAP
ncbi:MAG: gamma-glutamyltransferase [Gammaproteobacteria bacterium]|nr:gamma-glutamyltransferase [Gammaproteobacteria bacterium]